jgi:hypothetical protein
MFPLMRRIVVAAPIANSGAVAEVLRPLVTDVRRAACACALVLVSSLVGGAGLASASAADTGTRACLPPACAGAPHIGSPEYQRRPEARGQSNTEKRPFVTAGLTDINFDDLPAGGITGVEVTNQYPSATFSSTPGSVNYVSTQEYLTDSKPNFICTGPLGAEINCAAPTIVTFTAPIQELTFSGIGVNYVGQVAAVEIYVKGALAATVPIIGNGTAEVPLSVNLTAYTDVTSIVLTDITDGGGIGWDDFRFEASGGGGGTEKGTWPPGGLGYSFPNRSMQDYVAGAGMRPYQVLRPGDLEQTFSDWSYHPLVGGSLGTAVQEEAEILFGIGPLSALWRAMEGGVCYGLALDGGRFDGGQDALYSPPEGRSDATWNVSGGPPSATTKLPEPSNGVSAAYDEQFLRLTSDDFLTQFSTQALASRHAQEAVFSGTGGAGKLRAQLESIMDHGVDLYDHSGRLSAPASGLALLELQAYDPTESYGHAVVAYRLRVSPSGTFQIGVWDNNFPLAPQEVLVRPDGTWEYHAPYRSLFGYVYSFNGASGHTGRLEAKALYAPKGLNYYPSSKRSSIVDVGPGGRASTAIDEEGNEAFSQLTASDTLGYAGESLEFETAGGELELEGTAPTLNVRGADASLSLAATGNVRVAENPDQSSIAVGGAAAKLGVARGGLFVESEGASGLHLDESGGVAATAGSSGHLLLTAKYESGGALDTVILFSAAAAEGAQITLTAAQVAEAELGFGPPPPPSPKGGVLTFIGSSGAGHGSGGQGRDAAVRPQLSGARVSNRAFRVGRAATALVASHGPVGTVFRFALNTPAGVDVTLQRMVAGIRRNGRCTPRPGRRTRGASRCTITKPVGALTRASEAAGSDTIAFSGRLGRKPLGQGNYRAVLVASNATGRSTPAVVSFTVVRG